MWVSLNFWITSSLSHVLCVRHNFLIIIHLFPLVALAKITLTLPKETSSAELLSPNYPDSFPDDDVMEWYFQVPDKHKTSVQFLKHGQPSCLKKDTAVEYHNKGRGALVLRLTDPQPEHNLGNFSLTLRNCEMDRRRAGSPGLSLNFKVVSSSISSPGLYIICIWCCLALTFLSLLRLLYIWPSEDRLLYISNIYEVKWSDSYRGREKFWFLGWSATLKLTETFLRTIKRVKNVFNWNLKLL